MLQRQEQEELHRRRQAVLSGVPYDARRASLEAETVHINRLSEVHEAVQGGGAQAQRDASAAAELLHAWSAEPSGLLGLAGLQGRTDLRSVQEPKRPPLIRVWPGRAKSSRCRHGPAGLGEVPGEPSGEHRKPSPPRPSSADRRAIIVRASICHSYYHICLNISMYLGK